MPRKLAAIYARSATQKGDISQQLEKCRASCQDHGYTTDEKHIYYEVGLGSTIDSPKLTKLRQAMKAKEFDVIVVASVDRLSRKLSLLELIFDEAESVGVEIKSVEFDFDHRRAYALIHEAIKASPSSNE